MNEARLPFTMKATVTYGASPPPAPLPDPLPPGWVRIPVSFQVRLPAEVVERARQGGADAGSGHGPDTPVRIVPGSLRLGAEVQPDDARAGQDVEALLRTLQDEPPPPAFPPASAWASRDDERPISAEALNSLGLGAAFGRWTGSRPAGAVRFDTVGGLPSSTSPDAGEANDTAGGGDRPADGTGRTVGTTGNRALDRVLKADRIGTPRRVPPSADAAGPAEAGDGRASLQPAVDRQTIMGMPPGGAAGDAQPGSPEPASADPVGLRGSFRVPIPGPIPSIPSDTEANALVRQLASMLHGLGERAAEANDAVLKALEFDNPAVAAEVRLLASLSQTLHARLAEATGDARAAIETEIQAVAEELLSLEYRGQLRNNTLGLLSQVQPDIRKGLNQDPEQTRLEIHHTVPYADPEAERARELLGKWGLSVHDPADAAIVPSSYHRGEDIHGMADPDYSTIVNEALKEADEQATEAAVKGGRKAGRAVMLDAVRALSDWLVNRSGDSRAIGLEQTLRTLERPLPRPDLASYTAWKGYGP